MALFENVPETFGTPGFNPNARDPRIAASGGGLGLGGRVGAPRPAGASRALGFPTPAAPPRGPNPPGGPTATPEPAPLSGLERIALGVGDFAAGFRGQAGPSQRLMQIRQQQFQQRQQDALQSYAILNDLQKFVDAGPVAEAPERIAKVRERFVGVYGPDSGDFFDETVGKSVMTPGMLAELEGDEVAKAQMASLSVEDYRKYARSPARWEALRTRADRRDLDGIVRPKLAALLNTKDPAVRRQVDAALADGQLTSEDLRGINEGLPDQLRFKPSELEVIARNEPAVAQMFPKVFTTSAEFIAARDRKAEELSRIRVARATQTPKTPPDQATVLRRANQVAFETARAKAIAGVPLTDGDKKALELFRPPVDPLNAELARTMRNASEPAPGAGDVAPPSSSPTPAPGAAPGATRGKPTQADIDRVADALDSDDVNQIRAALRAEGFEI